MSQLLHDIKNLLGRLEIMANLLERKDFSTFSQAEIETDIAQDLARLQELFKRLSSGR